MSGSGHGRPHYIRVKPHPIEVEDEGQDFFRVNERTYQLRA